MGFIFLFSTVDVIAVVGRSPFSLFFSSLEPCAIEFGSLSLVCVEIQY